MKVKLILSAIAASMVLSTTTSADSNTKFNEYQTALRAVFAQQMAFDACGRAGAYKHSRQVETGMLMNMQFVTRYSDFGDQATRYQNRLWREKVWDDVEALFNKPGSNEFAATARGFIGVVSEKNYQTLSNVDTWEMTGNIAVIGKNRSWKSLLSTPGVGVQGIPCDNLLDMIEGVYTQFIMTRSPNNR